MATALAFKDMPGLFVHVADLPFAGNDNNVWQRLKHVGLLRLGDGRDSEQRLFSLGEFIATETDAGYERTYQESNKSFDYGYWSLSKKNTYGALCLICSECS